MQQKQTTERHYCQKSTEEALEMYNMDDTKEKARSAAKVQLPNTRIGQYESKGNI